MAVNKPLELSRILIEYKKQPKTVRIETVDENQKKMIDELTQLGLIKKPRFTLACGPDMYKLVYMPRKLTFWGN